jgi:hypothetical protein
MVERAAPGKPHGAARGQGHRARRLGASIPRSSEHNLDLARSGRLHGGASTDWIGIRLEVIPRRGRRGATEWLKLTWGFRGDISAGQTAQTIRAADTAF